MYDMGVYPLNATRYVTGLEPVAVTAQQSTTRPEIYKEVDETMQFRLEFPEGIVADCETSFGKNMNTLNVKCNKGGYKLEPFQQYSGIAGITPDINVYRHASWPPWIAGNWSPYVTTR